MDQDAQPQEALNYNVYALAALKPLNPDLEALASAMRSAPRPEPEKPQTPAPAQASAWIPKIDNWLKKIMAFSQEQFDALEAAIASGTLEVRVGDKMVRYQTTADMIHARDLVRDQLGAQNPADRTSYASFGRD